MQYSFCALKYNKCSQTINNTTTLHGYYTQWIEIRQVSVKTPILLSIIDLILIINV